MHRSAVYASNEIQRILKQQQANLDPSFVKCMGAAVNMLKATRLELFPFHILREDKRAHLLSITEDILKLVKRFTEQVKLEYDTFKELQSTLPTLPSGQRIDLADPTPLLELVEVIKHWKKVLPPLRKASRSVEFTVLDHFATFFQEAIFVPFCGSKRSPNDRSSTTLRPVIDAIALGLEHLILTYKRLNDCRVDVEHELEAAFRRVEDIPFEWKQHLYELSLDSSASTLSPVGGGTQAETTEPVPLAAPQLPTQKPLEDLSQVDLIKKFTLHSIRIPDSKPNTTVGRVVSTSSQETVTPTPRKPTPPARSKKRPVRLFMKTSGKGELYSDVVPSKPSAADGRASTNLKMDSFARVSSAKSSSAPENVYPVSADHIVHDLRKVQSEQSRHRDPQSPAKASFPRLSDVEKVQKDDHEGLRDDSCDMLDFQYSPVDTGSPEYTSSPTKLSIGRKIKEAMGYQPRSGQRKTRRSNTTQSSSSGTGSSPYVSQHASRSQSRTGLHTFQGSLGSVKEHGTPVPFVPKQPMPTLQRTKTEPEQPVLVKDFGATTSLGSVGSSDSGKAAQEGKPSVLKRMRSKAQINARDRNNTWPG